MTRLRAARCCWCSWETHTHVDALPVFEDPATGTSTRERIGRQFLRIWDLAAGGAALFVLKGHTSYVFALTAFADPATGEMRLASGSDRRTCAVTRARAERTASGSDMTNLATAVGATRPGSLWLQGKRWGEMRIETARRH